MFEVVLTPKAESDLQQSVDWWGQHHSLNEAERWYNGILATIESLSNLPHRCPLVRNTKCLGREVRQLLYGVSSKLTHRIYFGIDGDTVTVYRVLATSQVQPSKPDDLSD